MPQHLQKVNILRGVAILLVFSYHALLVIFGSFEIYDFSPSGWWIDFRRYAPGRILLGMTPGGMGAQGVTLFLVISGFLIHWGYLKSGATFRFREFFNKRFWRIYPPYLLALLAFSLSFGSGGLLSLLAHLTLTHNLADRTLYTINASFWSLALEMQLYLLYPALLLLRRGLGIGKATLAVGLLALLSMGGSAALQLPSPALWLSPLHLWIVWALGAYFGEQFFYRRRIFTASPYYLAAGYLLLTLSEVTVLYAVAGRILFSLFFICVLDWYLHRPEAEASWATNALVKFMALVGTYSYSIYLFHQPLLRPLISFFSGGHTSKPVLGLAVGASFAVVFAWSYLTYRLVERPAIRWGQRFFQRYAGPVAAARSISLPA
jgi:peptidoglycan/LPS O-acetylase OafA/YrhL